MNVLQKSRVSSISIKLEGVCFKCTTTQQGLFRSEWAGTHQPQTEESKSEIPL